MVPAAIALARLLLPIRAEGLGGGRTRLVLAAAEPEAVDPALLAAELGCHEVRLCRVAQALLQAALVRHYPG